MPGFFETIERDLEARSAARRLAGGCPICEAALVPISRLEARTGLTDPKACRRILARHRRHDPAATRPRSAAPRRAPQPERDGPIERPAPRRPGLPGTIPAAARAVR